MKKDKGTEKDKCKKKIRKWKRTRGLKRIGGERFLNTCKLHKTKRKYNYVWGGRIQITDNY